MCMSQVVVRSVEHPPSHHVGYSVIVEHEHTQSPSLSLLIQHLLLYFWCLYIQINISISYY